jgi:hypothetical protein
LGIVGHVAWDICSLGEESFGSYPVRRELQVLIIHLAPPFVVNKHCHFPVVLQDIQNGTHTPNVLSVQHIHIGAHHNILELPLGIPIHVITESLPEDRLQNLVGLLLHHSCDVGLQCQREHELLAAYVGAADGALGLPQ